MERRIEILKKLARRFFAKKAKEKGETNMLNQIKETR